MSRSLCAKSFYGHSSYFFRLSLILVPIAQWLSLADWPLDEKPRDFGDGSGSFCKGKRGPGNEAVLIMHTVVVINAKSAEDAECEKLDF